MRIIGQLLLALAVFLTSVVLCAIGGGMIGHLIARQYPHYYPSMFPTAATQPFFDSEDVGVGTGIGQGAAAGLLVGTVIVLALAIANRRRTAAP